MGHLSSKYAVQSILLLCDFSQYSQSTTRQHLKQRAWVGLYIKRVWTKWNLQRMSRNYKGAKGIFQVLCGGESWRTTQFEMRKPARTPQVPFLQPSGGAPCPALWLAKMTSVQLSRWIEMRSGSALVLCNQTRSKSRHSTVTSYNSREKVDPVNQRQKLVK